MTKELCDMSLEELWALFPYMVTFEFCADGKTYTCKRRSNFLSSSPSPGDRVSVTYSAADPERCRIFICDKTIPK